MANTPTAPEVVVRAERAAAREALALEFADLDEDEDRIWIDLEGIVEAPAATSHKTEPVAFFAANDDDRDSAPSRQSGPVEPPRGSIVEEVTKPVPPPEP